MELEYTYDAPKTVTPNDVYGQGWSAPKGYEIIAFRPPNEGEWYLNAAILDRILAFTDFNLHEPRLILRALPKREVVPDNQPYCQFNSVTTVESVYGGDVTLPEGYRMIAFRPTEKGDLYLVKSNRSVDSWFMEHATSRGPRIIVERVGG